MFRHYRTLLRTPGATSLIISSLLGRLPTVMAPLAVLLLLQARTGSFALAGIAAGCGALSNALSAPLHGFGVDRSGPRRWLSLTATAQLAASAAVVIAAQASAADWILILAATARGAVVPPITSCVRTLWPALLGDRAETAYALDAITQEAIFLTGPLLVAGCVAVWSPQAAVVAQALIMLAGTGLFVSTPALRHFPPRPAGPGPRRSALAARGFRVALLSIALSGVALGATEVALPALSVHLGARSLGGVLLAMLSLGSIIGGLLYGLRPWHAPIIARHALLLVAMGLASLPLVIVPPVGLAIGLSILAGLPYAPTFSTQYALVSATAPPHTTTEAFSWQASALVGGAAAGSALAGWTVARIGLAGALALPVIATLLAALPLATTDHTRRSQTNTASAAD
jgi:MFS family permease